MRDISIEREILAHAPWGMPPRDPALARDGRWSVMNGALWFRAGDWARALESWLPWLGRPGVPQRLPEWAALALGRAGRIAEALALLGDRPSHLRGEVLAASGDLAGALVVLSAELARPGSKAPTQTWRSLRLAACLERMGRPAAGAEALEARLAVPGLFERELHAEAARLHGLPGHPERAVPHLTALAPSAPGLVNRLEAPFSATDPRFQWIPERLRLLGADERVWLLREDQATNLAAALWSGSEGRVGVVPRGERMWAALGESALYRAFAQCPFRPPRSVVGDRPGLLLFDPERPDTIALCLHPDIPAFLWPRAPAGPEGVEALLAPYARTLDLDEPSLRDLPLQWGVGLVDACLLPDPLTGAWRYADADAFGKYAAVSPFLETPGWGGTDVEDPFGEFVNVAGLSLLAALRAHSAQDPERVPSESYRTRHSRSIVSHRTGPFADTLTVRYRPNPHPGSVAAINRRLGTHFPKDLPLDVVGVFLPFVAARDAAWWRRRSDPDGATFTAELSHESLELDRWLATQPGSDRRSGRIYALTFNRLGWLLHLAADDPTCRAHVQTGPSVDWLLREDDEDEEEDEE